MPYQPHEVVAIAQRTGLGHQFNPRGAKLPFAIVFLGVLGGVLAFGVIGVFLGPTLLAVGYSLAIEWTSATASQAAANNKDRE
ncbi:MAG TPA: hypothetical protein VIM43_02445 [Rugosibacter sp.]